MSNRKNRIKKILEENGGWMTVSQIKDKWPARLRVPNTHQLTMLTIRIPGVVRRAPNGKSYENKEYALKP